MLDVVQVFQGLHEPHHLLGFLRGEGDGVLGVLHHLHRLHPHPLGLQGLGDPVGLRGLGVDGEVFPFLLQVQGAELNGRLLGRLGVLGVTLGYFLNFV